VNLTNINYTTNLTILVLSLMWLFVVSNAEIPKSPSETSMTTKDVGTQTLTESQDICWICQ